MSKSLAYSMLVAAVGFLIVVAVLIYMRDAGEPETQQQAFPPPLPAGAQMFGNWALIGCQEGAGDGPCILQLRIVNAEAQRVVFRLNLARAQNDNDVMLVQLPPSVVIPAGVTLTPAGGTAITGSIRTCRPAMCVGGMLLNDMFVQELSAAEAVTLSFVGANGRNININLPSAGFAEGFAAWRERIPAVAGDAEEGVEPEVVPEAAPN
jgi:invasion protein IalB